MWGSVILGRLEKFSYAFIPAFSPSFSLSLSAQAANEILRVEQAEFFGNPGACDVLWRENEKFLCVNLVEMGFAKACFTAKKCVRFF